MKFFRSLLARYMLIIVTAIFLIQFTFIITPLWFVTTDKFNRNDNLEPSIIEEKWHEEASNLLRVNKEVMERHFDAWKEIYPNAGMFWVDSGGKLVVERDIYERLPTDWTASSTAQFIKERYDKDPFTVIAFVGNKEEDGFIVFEIPRDSLNQVFYEKYGDALLITSITIITLFIIVSFLFFRSIRKRLLHLQEAMEIRDIDDLPIQIPVKKKDEIGQLELTFNEMVAELKESKQREKEEEQLRRKLIANLSHDLRTPLTKIRANTYSLGKEDLTKDGEKAVQAMEKSIKSVDGLVENLVSYTLLKASKYTFKPEKLDIARIIRTSLATWYPLFEQEHIEVDVQLDGTYKQEWIIDRVWMERILDNLFQNVLRHAKEGQYIGVSIESTEPYDAIVIKDHGKGMNDQSDETGAGIGLSIVDMMVRGMNLSWKVKSNENGTVVKIMRLKNGVSKKA